MALTHPTFKPTSRGISSFEIIRICFAFVLICSLVLSANTAAFAASQPLSNDTGPLLYKPGSFVPGEVIVKFKDTSGGKRVNNAGLEPDRLLRNSINQTYGFASFRDLDQLPGYFQFFANKSSDMQKLVAAISLDPLVEYAEPNFIVQANSLPGTPPPDDPLYNQTYVDPNGDTQSRQWYLSKIGITDLWNIVTGTTQTVAIVDTGLSPIHQDLCLANNFNFVYNSINVSRTTLTPADFVTSENIDNLTGSDRSPVYFNATCPKYQSKFQAIPGFNFVADPPIVEAFDDNGHGTALAGIIAATTNNQLGIAGMNWQTNILPVKVMDANGTGTSLNVAQGIAYAADKGARIINLSLSVESNSPVQVLQAGVTYAQNKGALIVAAVGPYQLAQSSFPAAYPGVIGVGATDINDKLVFNEYGNYISVVAPGKDIFTTYCDFITAQGSQNSITNPPVITPINSNFTKIFNKSITFKDASESCKNPQYYYRYPVSRIFYPCDNSDINSCYQKEQSYKIKDATSIVSDVQIINGVRFITETTTVSQTYLDVHSYYLYLDGSSFSAAIVSGLASLILAAKPEFNAAQVKALLENTADPIPGYNSAQVGHGRVNASRIADAIVTGGTGIFPPNGISIIQGTVTGIGDPADTVLNLDPYNTSTTPISSGGFRFDNLGPGTYYLRLRVKSSGRIMGPVKIILTGQSGEVFSINFDVEHNLIICGPGSVCPGNGPDPSTPTNAFGRSSPIPGAFFYNETGHNLSNGFKDYWVQNGGLAIFGFPISEEFSEVSPTDGKTYTVQYFQRNRFEYHPEKLPPYKVLLGLLGSEATTGKISFPPVDPIAPTANGRYFSETGHSLKNQFLAYWQSHGGLAIFGYPISEAFQEGPYFVQYFQRNRFELHPENYGTPYEVLLGLLGTDLARARSYM